MTENDFIRLEKIDISTAAQNFANLLNENKTYFLNGTWGSGKSTFLKEVDNLKPINNIKKVKLVTIDFWRLNDSRSTLETVFANLHPFVYWGLRLIVILCIALSILMTNVVDLGLSAYVPNWVVLFAGVIALIVAIHQFLKIKSDGIYSWLLTKTAPNKDHTLQVLIYYIMGLHSFDPDFLSIENLGFYNPRKNIVYQLPVSSIPLDLIQTIENEVIGYK